MLSTLSPGSSVMPSTGKGFSAPTVKGSAVLPPLIITALKIRIDRMKLNTGPAATVAVRAQSGAPCMVWRRRSGGSAAIAAPSLPLAASASPKNLTKPPNGSAASCQRVPCLSVRAKNTGPNPSENTSALIPDQRPTM